MELVDHPPRFPRFHGTLGSRNTQMNLFRHILFLGTRKYTRLCPILFSEQESKPLSVPGNNPNILNLIDGRYVGLQPQLQELHPIFRYFGT